MSSDFLMPLLTYPDPTPADAVLRAVDFAATLGGRVSIVTHNVDIPPITNPLATTLIDFAGMAANVEAESKKRGERLASEAANQARRFQLTVQHVVLYCRLGSLQSQLAELARPHDMSLLAMDSSSQSHLDAAEALLFGSGGPLALFPAGAATHIETVVVAWDGGRSAARTVRDAMPILRLAKKVVLLTVGDDKHVPPASVAALRTFLSGHDVASHHHDVTREGYSIGETLQSHALAHDGGLLVMGAYGHSRMREFVLGGATRSVLAGLRLPIFMSH